MNNNNIDNQGSQSMEIVPINNKNDLVENIKRWVIIDSQLKIINEKTKKLRNMKHELTENICNFKSKNNIDNTVKISDGELRFYEKKEYNPLTFGYIEKSLANIIPDKSQVDYIISYLKENRETSVSTDIRRVYKNK
jgi:hypothetical protein